MSDNHILVRIENLTKHFPVERGILIQRRTGAIQAVDDVTLDIKKGETMGLVGESGCGKSTLGRTILKLYHPTSGKVLYEDHDLTQLEGVELRNMRRRMQMIFQDPYASLNPRMPVSWIVAEPLLVHGIGNSAEHKERVRELLQLVGLNPYYLKRYPHEFSGGQRQRIGIARALALQPDFIVLDEPISSLDVSIQAQVVNLLQRLQRQFNLTYLFIAHDLSMVRHISDRVAVMYLGKVVELAQRDEMFANPLHPYTRALLSAVPIPNPKKERARQRTILTGDVPSPANPPSGCRFHTRCPIAEPQCSQLEPEWRDIHSGHWVACHLV
jgi:oligopeptide transport system ATP-binding protein